MRWNGLRHLRNANVLRHAVRGLVARATGKDQPAATNSPQKKPKAPTVAPTSRRPVKKLRTAVRKATGSSKAKTPTQRTALATKLRAQRSTAHGRKALRTTVSRQLGSP